MLEYCLSFVANTFYCNFDAVRKSIFFFRFHHQMSASMHTYFFIPFVSILKSPVERILGLSLFLLDMLEIVNFLFHFVLNAYQWFKCLKCIQVSWMRKLFFKSLFRSHNWKYLWYHRSWQKIKFKDTNDDEDGQHS